MNSENSTPHTQLSIPNDVNNDKKMCPVCLESEIQTRFLQCIHVICEPCLQDLIKCSEGNTFKCPLCRKEYYVDTFSPVKSRQYGEQNNHYAETSFSSQWNLTTISERVQNAEDRQLADRVMRGNNDTRINQRRQLRIFFTNVSEYARCVCKPCIQAVGFVCMVHLILVAIVRFILGTFVIWTNVDHRSFIAWYTIMDWIFKFPIQRRCQFSLGNKMSSEDSTELPIPNDGKNDKELCPVCCESEIRSRFLPCIHMICEPCLQNLIKCSEGNTFKCPLCRKEYYVDTFAPVKSRQYGEQNYHYAETSFSRQGNLTTISERVQYTGGRRLADRVIRSLNDSRINQRPQTFSNNESECVCCQPYMISMEFTVYMVHLTLIATARFVFGLFMVCTDKGDRVAIFEIVKGATDFFIAMILWRDVKWHCCKYFRMVLVLASEILMGFGTYFILSDMFNAYFLGWYTIVDWVMIFCIIRYMYCVVKDD